MNARQELVEELVKANSSIKCAIIKYVSYSIERTFILSINYTKNEHLKFFEDIDYDYDAGYGSQELEGTVWLENGTWLERGEYDGSEWWEHKVRPDIPKECYKSFNNK